MNSTNDFETIVNALNAQGGYTNRTTNNFDYDLTFVVDRVELRTSTETMDATPLAMFPSKRVNFIDGEATLETKLILESSSDYDGLANFLAKVWAAASNQFKGNWAFIIMVKGTYTTETGTFNMTWRGLFLLNNANVSGTESDMTMSVNGNVFYGLIYAGN
ncbi:MAG: hypothetical protein NZM44_00400 [Candidatus Calescibacterium sp.]|nr:hypothetical protein [Candidatus Calescibacterium sp.]